MNNKMALSAAPLFQKLNLGELKHLVVLGAPSSFEPELAKLHAVKIARDAARPFGFALAFAITQAQLDDSSAKLAKAAQGDAVLWIAYPKGTSKKYKCEFHRDSGWKVLGAAGYEPVRQVAIDDDWTALRFRKVEHIKTMTRRTLGTISAAGKARASAAAKNRVPAKNPTPAKQPAPAKKSRAPRARRTK